MGSELRVGVITIDPTFQSDSLWAVEVQQGGEGAAFCVVLQQVFHQGERWSIPLLDMLPPVASLKPRQRHRDITDSYVSQWWIYTIVCL